MSKFNIHSEPSGEQTDNITISALNKITDGTESLDEIEKAYRILKAQADVNHSDSNRKLREKYASISYSFAKYTIAFWMFLFFVYFLSPSEAKPLNDTALGIFTTACTINVLAAFVSIAKGLFHSDKK
jgi:hypothetical protein